MVLMHCCFNFAMSSSKTGMEKSQMQSQMQAPLNLLIVNTVIMLINTPVVKITGQSTRQRQIFRRRQQ
jgi:hypothetical protein